ncbi:unnamed protein product [Effrenium voratum]|nr:unnamed protein product [Effrenium voratum]
MAGDPRPVRPDEDALEGLDSLDHSGRFFLWQLEHLLLLGMGFPKGARMHGFEEAPEAPSGSFRELRSALGEDAVPFQALSMEAHVWLAEQGLRQEMRGSEANKSLQGSFELLEKCLALRLRRGYRHFLRPPLVVDVLVNEIEDPEKVRLPESYELLTGDLNHFSPPGGPRQNLPGDGAESGATKKQGRKLTRLLDTDKFLKGRGTFPIEFYEKSWDEMRKHVYVIGQRFDAWENWYPVPIRRLCNMKVAFAVAASSAGEPGTSASRARHLARVTESEAWVLERQKLRTGMHEKQLDGEAWPSEPQPWLASYRSGSPVQVIPQAHRERWDWKRSMRLSVELPVVGLQKAWNREATCPFDRGFEVLEESEQLREALLKQLTKDGLVTHRASFGILTVTLRCCHREAIEPAAPLDDATLLPEAAATEQQAWLTRRLSEAIGHSWVVSQGAMPTMTRCPWSPDFLGLANSEKLLPPWSPLMDAASLASHQVLDLACLVTKHMHACAPSASFNGLLRTDLRQTPGELRGKPFQSYVLLAAAVEAPSPALATRRLRILRALHSLWKAKAAGDDFFSEEKAPPAEGEARGPTGAFPWRKLV